MIGFSILKYDVKIIEENAWK